MVAVQRPAESADDARRPLTRRPTRSRDELEERVGQALEEFRAAFPRATSSFVAESGDGRARCREQMRTESDASKSEETKPHGLYRLSYRERAIFERVLSCMTYSQLWWTLYLFDENRQSERCAKHLAEEAFSQASAAMRKLEAFAEGVAGVQTEEERRVFDAREELLVNQAAYERLKVEQAGVRLENVQGETTRTLTWRRRLAVARLRASLPHPLFTWDDIAELIYASDRMYPMPSHSFVERCNKDRVKLAGLLKKDAQRDNSRPRAERHS